MIPSRNTSNALARSSPRTLPATLPYHFPRRESKRNQRFRSSRRAHLHQHGTIQAADNEAQLAGVMAHEISHVSNATQPAPPQADEVQMPLQILGALLGRSSLGQLLPRIPRPALLHEEFPPEMNRKPT